METTKKDTTVALKSHKWVKKMDLSQGHLLIKIATASAWNFWLF